RHLHRPRARPFGHRVRQRAGQRRRQRGLSWCHPERAGAAAKATRDRREAISLDAKRFAAVRGRQENYWIYIMTGRTRVLYVGVTNDLARRVSEHKGKLVP